MRCCGFGRSRPKSRSWAGWTSPNDDLRNRSVQRWGSPDGASFGRLVWAGCYREPRRRESVNATAIA